MHQEPTLQVLPSLDLEISRIVAGVDLVQVVLQYSVDQAIFALEVVIELALSVPEISITWSGLVAATPCAWNKSPAARRMRMRVCSPFADRAFRSAPMPVIENTGLSPERTTRKLVITF
jgi:hypothetical protein